MHSYAAERLSLTHIQVIANTLGWDLTMALSLAQNQALHVPWRGGFPAEFGDLTA